MIYKGQGQSLPDLVICHFPDYTGPSYLSGQEKMVPLAPLQASWTVKGQQFSRSQYPLILGWAITIHKAQGSTLTGAKKAYTCVQSFPVGMTLGKVIINLSEREFSNGLTYTAVTRVRQLSDIAFRPYPNFLRYYKCRNCWYHRLSHYRISRIFGTASFKERLKEVLFSSSYC